MGVISSPLPAQRPWPPELWWQWWWWGRKEVRRRQCPLTFTLTLTFTTLHIRLGLSQPQAFYFPFFPAYAQTTKTSLTLLLPPRVQLGGQRTGLGAETPRSRASLAAGLREGRGYITGTERRVYVLVFRSGLLWLPELHNEVEAYWAFLLLYFIWVWIWVCRRTQLGATERGGAARLAGKRAAGSGRRAVEATGICFSGWRKRARPARKEFKYFPFIVLCIHGYFRLSYLLYDILPSRVISGSITMISSQ